MSKIANSIHEINKLDELARRNQWINQLHPLVKLLVTLFYIITVVSFDKYNFSGLISMSIYPIILFTLSDLSFIDSLYRMRMVLPLVCFIGVFNPFFDKIPLYTFGPITITSGFISMITLMMKGILTVLSSYLLIGTTTIEGICSALKKLHVPQIMITQILLSYRYITLLLKEVNTITEAYALRAPNEKGIHFKVWGSLTGQLLLRTMDKANTVYDSMCLRGYNGNFYLNSVTLIKPRDYVYLFSFTMCFIILRFVPISHIITTLFT